MTDETASLGQRTTVGNSGPSTTGAQEHTVGDVLWRVLLIAGAFVLYFQTSAILEMRNSASSFGADSLLYRNMAYGDIDDRLTRFHPVTVLLAVGWLNTVGAIFASVQPHEVLRALFAAVGAVGVWAALSSFAVLVPKRYVLLCGLIYATSLGIWYFSSIAESKIITASLASLYIAIYLHLRENWSVRKAALLSATLAAACLNEIVSGLLIAIPIVDALLGQGKERRAGRWMVPHGLTVLAAFIILEFGVSRLLPPPVGQVEGASHFSLFWFYVMLNDHGIESFYAFVLNWFPFNIAAPEPGALDAIPLWPGYLGYFEPSFKNYIYTLSSFWLLLLVAVVILASVFSSNGTDSFSTRNIILALIAYSLCRATFFFIFNPPEAMLFSPAVTLAHLIAVLVPFTASNFPAKGSVLFIVAMLLFLTNLQFVLGELLIEKPVF